MSKNYFKTKYMEILLPIIAKHTGEKQKEAIINALYTIDSHNHSESYGKKVTPSGIVIDKDLIFNTDINSLKEIRLKDNEEVNINSSFYIKNGDFYTTDSEGNEIQLTVGRRFNIGSGDVIGGDYQESNAEILYDEASETYFFKAAPGVDAKISVSSLVLKADNGEAVEIKASDTTESYNIRLPVDSSEIPCIYKIDNNGQIIVIKRPQDVENEDTFLIVSDNEIVVDDLKLKYFPKEELSPYQTINVRGENEIRTANEVGFKVPLLTTLEGENFVSGSFGVYDNKFKLYTNQWYDILTQSIEGGISFNSLVDVDINNPQNGQYFSYDSETKEFSNKPYPTVKYTDLINTPDDITDLSQLNIRGLGDVNNLSWLNPNAQGHVLKWSNSLNSFVLSPDGGVSANWGSIVGDPLDNPQILNLSNEFLNRHDSDKHLGANSDLFSLEDVTGGETVSERFMILRYRDVSEEEEDFEYKFVLEEYIPPDASPFKGGGNNLKGQLYSFIEGKDWNLPDETHLYPLKEEGDSWVFASDRSLGVSILKHVLLSDVQQIGGGNAFIFKISNDEDKLVAPLLKGLKYKIEVLNKGLKDLVINHHTFENPNGEGVKPSQFFEDVVVETEEDSNLTFTPVEGFTGVAYVYILPVAI